jgi:hypothetical protein
MRRLQFADARVLAALTTAALDATLSKNVTLAQRRSESLTEQLSTGFARRRDDDNDADEEQEGAEEEPEEEEEEVDAHVDDEHADDADDADAEMPVAVVPLYRRWRLNNSRQAHEQWLDLLHSIMAWHFDVSMRLLLIGVNRLERGMFGE